MSTTNFGEVVACVGVSDGGDNHVFHLFDVDSFDDAHLLHALRRGFELLAEEKHIAIGLAVAGHVDVEIC